MKRRAFLAGLAWAGMSALVPFPAAAEDRAPSDHTLPGTGEGDASRFVRPARFFEKLENQVVRCRLCPRECEVSPGDRGHCGVRENRNGEYVTLVYGRAVALNNDPIEKKPFNHFRPGTMVLSTAAAGCNISCKFCQNWQISQFRPEEVESRWIPPEKLVSLARDNRIPNLAFTYSEPTVGYEYMLETAQKGHEAGLGCVTVSNGFIRSEPVKKLIPFLSAYKIDLKAFDESFYRDMCGGELKPVLSTLETLVRSGMWVEIVNLVLPTVNDEEKQVRGLARWVKTNLGPMVPVHFTRFHPMYRIKNLPPTPVSTLERCHDLAGDEGLKYVYIGNVPGHPLGNTLCHHCQNLLIRRTGLWSVENFLKDGRCPKCLTEIPGVWT